MTNTDRATERPWQTDYRKRKDGSFGQDIFDAEEETIAVCSWYPVKVDGGFETNREANAALIVHSVNSLPVALKALEEAKEYLDALAVSGYVTDPVDLDALLRRIDGLLTIKDSANG